MVVVVVVVVVCGCVLGGGAAERGGLRRAGVFSENLFDRGCVWITSMSFRRCFDFLVVLRPLV